MSRPPEQAESSIPLWESREVRQRKRLDSRAGASGQNNSSPRRIRRRVHGILEAGRNSGRLGLAFEIFLIALIVANALAVCLDSVPELGAVYGRFFLIFEYASVAIFSVEYVFRVWTAPEDPRFAERPLGDRLRYMVQPYMLIDLVAIAPAYIALFVPFAASVFSAFL